ncbi:glycoside hydrolase family 113 [Flagellimonas sediminis]|uniref:Glycoside hydrolase n=1 Tax=Flagellimonas sediminis TaxID=2696468 RepID=A0A6I5L131_9FLAO|nr:glycoside hydrolase [Allomuricauda sediminis]NDV44292.1 glycoside hydrolase [Allomuricauda sediminis]
MKKLIILVLLISLSCKKNVEDKVNGVSFVSSGDEVAQIHVNPVLDIHANYAAIMPFGFIPEADSSELLFNSERQWFGETRVGAKQYIEMLHKNGVHTMMKPQIWIRRGEFTGNLTMQSEAEWEKLEDSYSKFILLYAELAQETNTEILCIGTELASFVKNRPEYWNRLIAEVRKVYKGKITYAANWDEYAKTPFWDKLDYIGVNAYFPICERQNPTMQTMREGWQPWKTKLKELALEVKKPMLFTEFGYRSMDYTGKKPWLVDRNEEKVNLQAQADATQVLFEEFWDEEWFAGGFVWKWFMHHDKVGGLADNRFTPQNKPAESVIRKQYAKVKKYSL